MGVRCGQQRGSLHVVYTRGSQAGGPVAQVDGLLVSPAPQHHCNPGTGKQQPLEVGDKGKREWASSYRVRLEEEERQGWCDTQKLEVAAALGQVLPAL